MERNLEIMIALYDDEGLMIKDATPVSLHISRKLTPEEVKLGWIQVKENLLPEFKEFMKLAQQR